MSYERELFEAIKVGQMDRVEVLIEKPDIKHKINKLFEPEGETYLSVATRNGFYPIVELLLEKGADANMKTPDGQWPLHLAAFTGDDRVVKLLRQKSSSIEVVDEEGKTPLHWAVRNDNIKVIKFLVENGANVNNKTTEGNNCLHEAILNAKKSETISMILKMNADIHATNNRGETPLFSAARAGREKVMAKLISLGCSVGVTTNQGETMLHESARLGHLKVVQYLLDNIRFEQEYIDRQKGPGETLINGMSVETDRWTALHMAVAQGKYEVVKFLLGHGADKKIKNNDDFTAEDLVMAFKRTNIMPLFKPKEEPSEEGEEESAIKKKGGKIPADWRY